MQMNGSLEAQTVPKTWIGGGIYAVMVVALVATLCLVAGRLVNVPMGEVSEMPLPMIVLWAPLFATMLTGPVAFVFGAWAARSTTHAITAGRDPGVHRWSAAVGVGAAGAIYGAILSALNLLGWDLGWVLIPVGAMSGLSAGMVATWVAVRG